MAHKRFNYFSFWAIFCPFTPLTARKIKIKKNIKNAWISSFYISVPKNYDQMMYSSWDMAHDRCRCNCYFSFWAIFLPFYPLLNRPKNQNFEQIQKTHRDIIILHMYIYQKIWVMMNSSWGIVHDRCNCYFSFWAIICPFTPLSSKN